MLGQISTKVQPNRPHKTERPDFDGAGIDIHSAIGKPPKPKRGWTLPGHNYTGPYNPLEQQVNYDPETGQVKQIYINNQRVQQTRSQCNMMWTMVSVQTETKNTVKMKKIANTKRTKKMVKALDACPWKQRQWGYAAARNTINLKQKLGLGLKQK